MRTGYVVAARLLWAFLAGLAIALLGACSGSSVELISVTISGAPASALQPGQTVQLKATATYSDGVMQDVTAAAAWSTSNAAVFTVSSTGRVAAVAPGQAEAVAALDGRTARATLRVALPAAYFVDDVEYAFEYTLDAQGRIDSYRIAQRPGVAYAYPPEQDGALIACSGSLHGSFECRRGPAPDSGAVRVMRGETGRVTYAESMAPFNAGATATFTYGAQGLAKVASRLQPTASIHNYQLRSTEVAYDAAGRPVRVTFSGTDLCNIVCREIGTTSDVAFDAQGRMLHAESAGYERNIVVPDTVWTYFATDWLYAGTGAMTQAATAPVPADTTRFVADGGGWLASRTEHAGTANEVTDTYAIVRSGGAVAEERFTLAEPRFFYRRGRQVVRYEVDRLPSEPAFVPRAPDGKGVVDFIATVPVPFMVTFP
jgi:hypothetical protein